MNPRALIIVFCSLIAILLFFNTLSIALLFRQRSENDSLRARLDALTVEATRVAEERSAERQIETAAAPVVAAVATKTAAVSKTPLGYTAKQWAEAKERRDFLQNHFTQFPVITFKPATNSESVIQRFRINQYIVGKIKLERYTAFRFTVPEWIDGDFEWMFIYLTKADTDPRQRVYWGIVPEEGEVENFRSYELKPLTDYPLLKQQFPNSSEVFQQPLSRSSLQPGKSYAIWFSYSDVKVPEVALAMTINSERGHKEFGTLPLK